MSHSHAVAASGACFYCATHRYTSKHTHTHARARLTAHDHTSHPYIHNLTKSRLRAFCCTQKRTIILDIFDLVLRGGVLFFEKAVNCAQFIWMMCIQLVCCCHHRLRDNLAVCERTNREKCVSSVSKLLCVCCHCAIENIFVFSSLFSNFVNNLVHSIDFRRLARARPVRNDD